MHGLSNSLYVADELWAWPSDELLEAMLTGLVKNPMARFLGIHRGEPARLSARARTLESSGRRGEAQGRRHRSIRQAIRQVSRPHSLAQTGAILTA